MCASIPRTAVRKWGQKARPIPVKRHTKSIEMFSYSVRWSHLTSRKCSIRKKCSFHVPSFLVLFRSGYLFWRATHAKCYTTNNHQSRITMETATNSRCRKSFTRSHSSYWWCWQCIPFQVSVNVKYNYISYISIKWVFYGFLPMSWIRIRLISPNPISFSTQIVRWSFTHFK